MPSAAGSTNTPRFAAALACRSVNGSGCARSRARRRWARNWAGVAVAARGSASACTAARAWASGRSARTSAIAVAWRAPIRPWQSSASVADPDEVSVCAVSTRWSASRSFSRSVVATSATNARRASWCRRAVPARSTRSSSPARRSGSHRTAARRTRSTASSFSPSSASIRDWRWATSSRAAETSCTVVGPGGESVSSQGVVTTGRSSTAPSSTAADMRASPPRRRSAARECLEHMFDPSEGSRPAPGPMPLLWTTVAVAECRCRGAVGSGKIRS